MAATITVTKTDAYHFTVSFSEPIQGPGKTEAGQQVPISWLLSVLDYYERNADPKHGLSAEHRAIAPW